jgi:hypothetical protein
MAGGAGIGSPTGVLIVHWPTKVDSAGNAMTRSSVAAATGRWVSMSLKVRAKNSLNVA